MAVEYLIVTPDRSLVFTAMEYFMSSVRKASALYPGIIVVVDMVHVSAADFTTAYVNTCFTCLFGFGDIIIFIETYRVLTI